MKNDDEQPAGIKYPVRVLTEQDLLLGKKTVRFIGILCLICIVVSAGVAVFVWSSVPWATKLPYSGQFGRNGIPMQIAMLIVLVPLFGLWRSTKKPDSHHMGRGSRIRVYIFGTAMILGFSGGQWILAHSILVAGGALAG